MKKNLYLLILIFLCLINYSSQIKQKETITIYDIEEIPTPKIISDINYLYPNTNLAGIITIPNTDINEPIAQGKDNTYYLSHNIYNEKELAGSIFIDYRLDINKDKKIILYGHNATFYNPPFHELEKYYNESFTKKNRTIKLITSKKERTFTIFSVFIEPTDFTYMNLSIDEEHWLEHLKYLQDKSLYKLNINLNKDDKILILQTCSFLKKYQNYQEKYLIIVAKEE